MWKANLSTVWHFKPIVTISKGPSNVYRKERVEEAQGSDILGRTLHPHQTNPRFPPSALHNDVAAHSLLCLLGSTHTRENIDVPHWGSYNPCKGRVLEWRLRMYGMYHHLAWTFTCPPSLCKELGAIGTDPKEQRKAGQQQRPSQK